MDRNLIYEKGHWHIDSLPTGLKEGEEIAYRRRKPLKRSKSLIMLGVNLIPNWYNEEYKGNKPVSGFGLSVGVEIDYARYFIYAFAFFGGYMMHEIENSMNEPVSVTSFEMDYQMTIRLKLPLLIKRGLLTPYVLAGLEAAFAFNNEHPFVFALPFDAGVGLHYRYNNYFGFGFEVYRRFNLLSVHGSLKDIKCNLYYMFSL